MHNILTLPLAWDQILTILFVVFNPLRVVGQFAQLTRDAQQAFCWRLARRTTFFTAIGVIVAGILGQRTLAVWGIQQAILLLAGGSFGFWWHYSQFCSLIFLHFGEIFLLVSHPSLSLLHRSHFQQSSPRMVSRP